MSAARRASILAVLVVAGLASGAAAPPAESVKARLAVLRKKAPEGLADLRIIQEEAKIVLKTAIPATVGLRVGAASGSGVIISEDGYVLTAGHVSDEPGQECGVILPDGKIVKGKTLGWNRSIDSGLIKITTPGKYKYVPMGNSAKLEKGQWVVAVGHPRGFIPGRSPVVRVGRIVSLPDRFNPHIQTDCALVGGDSGGPLFDLNGRVIGIHSRINRTMEMNFHVPVDTYRETWARLDAAEAWPRVFRPSPAYIGVAFEPGGDDLKVTEVPEDAPGHKAGVKVGDILVQIDSIKLKKRSDLFDYMAKKKPGDEITLQIDREGKTMTIKLKLGKRPRF